MEEPKINKAVLKMYPHYNFTTLIDLIGESAIERKEKKVATILKKWKETRQR